MTSWIQLRFVGLYFYRIQYGPIFNHVDVILADKATEFDKIMQNNDHEAAQDARSFKVSDYDINRKPICNFVLAINTNLHPISRRFQVIADYWSSLHFRLGLPLFNILGEPVNLGP